MAALQKEPAGEETAGFFYLAERFKDQTEEDFKNSSPLRILMNPSDFEEI